MSTASSEAYSGGGVYWGSSPLDQQNLWFLGGFQVPKDATSEPPLGKIPDTPLNQLYTLYTNYTLLKHNVITTKHSGITSGKGARAWGTGGVESSVSTF